MWTQNLIPCAKMVFVELEEWPWKKKKTTIQHFFGQHI